MPKQSSEVGGWAQKRAFRKIGAGDEDVGGGGGWAMKG